MTEFTQCQGCHQERTCVVEEGVALCVKGKKGCQAKRSNILADIRKRGKEKERRRA